MPDRCGPPVHRRRHSLRRQLFSAFLLAIGLSVLLLGAVSLLFSTVETVKHRRLQIAEASEAIAQLVGSYLAGHQRGIADMAAVVEETGGLNRTLLEHHLQGFHRRSPELLTLVVTDARGDLIASERQLSLGGGPLAEAGSLNVADREYFRQPRASGRPYLSDGLLGRGFGRDPIVAIAVPWRARDGSFGGIVEGSLDLDRLGEVGSIFARLPAVEIFVVDGRGQLLWSGPAPPGEPLAPVTVDGTGARFAGEPRRRVLLARAGVDGTGWTVVVQQPMAEIYRSLLPRAWITLSWMAGGFLPAALFAHYLSRRITRPLEDLSASLDQVELGAALPELVPLRPNDPGEVATIVQATRRLLDRLETSYGDLSRVLAEREATIEEEIQQRTRAERERHQERKRVERMKDDFISVVSHELRTPLTSIRGSLSLITGGVVGELPEQTRMLVEIAAKNSERLVRLVNDILDLDKMESGTMAFRSARLELMPLLEQAVESNRAYCQLYGVDLRIVEGVAGAGVWGDGDRLQQVLANLLSNAAKNSPQGGAVEIGARRVHDRLRVHVTDHGPGIPPEFQPHVFEKFAQADVSPSRQRGGTGLGLSISKAIIEGHRGRLWFETTPETGTTFLFDLPEFTGEGEEERAGRSAIVPPWSDGDRPGIGMAGSGRPVS